MLVSLKMELLSLEANRYCTTHRCYQCGRLQAALMRDYGKHLYEKPLGSFRICLILVPFYQVTLWVVTLVLLPAAIVAAGKIG